MYICLVNGTLLPVSIVRLTCIFTVTAQMVVKKSFSVQTYYCLFNIDCCDVVSVEDGFKCDISLGVI